MPWQRVTISNADILLTDNLMDAFTKAHLDAGMPVEAVMFVDSADEGIFYFSPKAVEIAGAAIARLPC
jgi:hypothetical protein